MRINRWPLDSPHTGPVTLKAFPCSDVIMVQTFLNGNCKISQMIAKGKRDILLRRTATCQNEIMVNKSTKIMTIWYQFKNFIVTSYSVHQQRQTRFVSRCFLVVGYKSILPISFNVTSLTIHNCQITCEWISPVNIDKCTRVLNDLIK